MKLGPYAATPQALATLARNVADSARVNLFGFPKLPGTTAKELAAAALKANAREVLWAGTGHFNYMWVSDFAKSLRGAWDVLGGDYLRKQIDFITEVSAEAGRVPSCYSASGGFDMPWPRGDGLPWLIDAWAVRQARTGRGPSDERRRALQALVDAYEATHFDGALISKNITGDWVDTILRPSSTYNNVCALHMLKLLPSLGLKSELSPEEMEAELIAERLKARGLTDHHGTDALSVDAGVLALYLEVFSRDVRETIADGLEATGAAKPLPIRCAVQSHRAEHTPILTRFSSGYHQSVWLHLGLMYLNGLKKLGRDVGERKKKVEDVFLRHGNVLEAVSPEGKPYRGLFLSCEHGLSMAAGQYLELSLGTGPSEKIT